MGQHTDFTDFRVLIQELQDLVGPDEEAPLLAVVPAPEGATCDTCSAPASYRLDATPIGGGHHLSYCQGCLHQEVDNAPEWTGDRWYAPIR